MTDGDSASRAKPGQAETSSSTWLRVIAALVFVGSAVVAAIVQTPPAYVGLAVIVVLCIMMAFVGVATPRHYAIGAFVVTAILAGAAIAARPFWQVKGSDFLKLAVPAVLFGVSMLFWEERDNPKHWVKNVAGILAAAIVATVIYVCLFGDYAGFFAKLWLIGVGAVALTGLAKTAGKAWQWPLSILAVAAMAGILVRRSYADLPDRLTVWTAQIGEWTHTARIWPIVLAAIFWLLACLPARLSRQQVLTGLALIVLAGVIGREIWTLVSR